MDKWFNSPWFIRVISLLLAILLWTTVNLDDNSQSDALLINDGSKEFEVLSNIPLDVQYNDEKYTISGVPQSVAVTLEGPNSVMTPVVRQKNFEVYLDLQGYGPGTHTVDVMHSGISNRLNVNIEPKTVQVTVEEKVERDFEVGVDLINDEELVNNYEIGEATIQPSEVTVTGGKDLVDSVALVKAIVDVRDTTDTIENVQAPVKVYDTQGNELDVLVEPNIVNVTVPINLPSKQVPIEVQTKGEVPEGYAIQSVSPEVEEVTIYGQLEAISQIGRIANVEVDVSDLTESTTVEAEVPVPKGIKKVDPETVEVEVEVVEAEEQAEQVIEDVEIGVANPPGEGSVSFINPDNQQIAVTVYGNEADINNLKSEDIQAVIDVEGLEAGEHEVPIEVTGPENTSFELTNPNATIRIG
ncbi:YbbR domain-containing protein [Thalassobacillus cyri]|uniref:YbbR domain-containing protein n=1 Tax=Thalassobacillus cyri TaxID=571932 RepID=A0A1H4EEA6_9BACI|nr:CdaR family protein [Thalassobacillus cyri]SEA83276.1 YbbR domain-containing protein [Thalassobacillus cyri]